jgi:hypothetical protein
MLPALSLNRAAMKPANYSMTIVRGVAFGPVEFHCKTAAGTPTPLTGCQAFAQVRVRPGAAPVADLLPQITDALGGVVTIPKLTDEQTLALPRGNFGWDLVVQDASGDRLGPYVAGPLIITDIVTQAG